MIGCTTKIEAPSIIKTPHQKEEIIQETIITPQQEITTSSVIGEGYCGDDICQNLETQFPNKKVVCDRITRTCTINNKQTENNYVCERDCGIKCDEKVQLGFKPNGCQYTINKDIEVTLINTGKGDINGGFIYFITGANDEVEVQTTTKELKQNSESPYIINIPEELKPIKSIQIMPRVIKSNIVRDCSNKKLSLHLNSCY